MHAHCLAQGVPLNVPVPKTLPRPPCSPSARPRPRLGLFLLWRSCLAEGWALQGAEGGLDPTFASPLFGDPDTGDWTRLVSPCSWAGTLARLQGDPGLCSGTLAASPVSHLRSCTRALQEGCSELAVGGISDAFSASASASLCPKLGAAGAAD